MYKYSLTYMRNALLTIKFQELPGAFVNYCHTNGGLVAKVGTWFQVYAKTCIQENDGNPPGMDSRADRTIEYGDHLKSGSASQKWASCAR